MRASWPCVRAFLTLVWLWVLANVLADTAGAP